ncbi:hypothetical protein Trydic_g4238 [Trypoxylus dichotomus]
MYLDVTLDRSLTYKHYCEKTRQKVTASNNILSKLTKSKWGSKPEVRRSTALYFSTDGYACPVRPRSVHAWKVDVSVNETCRLVIRCMRATSLAKLYRAMGSSSLSSRRESHNFNDRFKQIFDNRHPLFDLHHGLWRLKSRRRFLVDPLNEPPTNYPLSESPAAGISCNFGTWRMLNRIIRTGVAPVKGNPIRWDLAQQNDDTCDCGIIQNMEYLLECANSAIHCIINDLWQSNPQALNMTHY